MAEALDRLIGNYRYRTGAEPGLLRITPEQLERLKAEQPLQLGCIRTPCGERYTWGGIPIESVSL